MPKELRPSQPAIEVLHSAPINSSAVEFFVRLPQPAAAKPFEAQYSFSSKGPWSPIGVSKKMVAWDESTFVIQVAGLKSTELYLRVAQGELRTKGVKVDLSSAEQSSGTMRKLLSAEPEEADDTDKGMEKGFYALSLLVIFSGAQLPFLACMKGKLLTLARRT